MRLYLVRHAEAKSKDEDPERPLTVRGRKQVTGIATSLWNSGAAPVKRILHSGKTRSLQTAEILTEHVAPKNGIRESDGLGPLEDPTIWAGRLSDLDEDLMLVGHLPHLGRLASLLLCGDEVEPVVAFAAAGTLCLERDETDNWTVQWMITSAAPSLRMMSISASRTSAGGLVSLSA